MTSKLKNLLFVIVMGSVCAGMLMGIRWYTIPIIEKYQEKVLKGTILNAAGVAYTDENMDELFETKVKVGGSGESKYYLSPEDDFIFEYKGRGLWGMIEGVITLKPDLKTIKNLQVISQEETPGLGARIVEKQFLDSFSGKILDPKLVLTKLKAGGASDKVEAITGATITTQALVNTINDSVTDFREKAAK